MAETSSPPKPIPASPNANNQNESNCFKKFLGKSQSRKTENSIPDATSVDYDHADTLATLANGVTAYKLYLPPEPFRSEENAPVIVCLHGVDNCSYMWADVADLLSDFPQGPQAKVVTFDFYGRGKSPWQGLEVSLDFLVMQTYNLLECKI